MRKNSWSSSELKKKLSTVIDLAQEKEQIIEVNGHPEAVLISFKKWKKIFLPSNSKIDKNFWKELELIKQEFSLDAKNDKENPFPRMKPRDP